MLGILNTKTPRRRSLLRARCYCIELMEKLNSDDFDFRVNVLLEHSFNRHQCARQ